MVVESREILGLRHFRQVVATFLIISLRVFGIIKSLTHGEILNFFDIISKSLWLKVLKGADKLWFGRVHRRLRRWVTYVRSQVLGIARVMRRNCLFGYLLQLFLLLNLLILLLSRCILFLDIESADQRRVNWLAHQLNLVLLNAHAWRRRFLL